MLPSSGRRRFPATHLYYAVTREPGAIIAQAKFTVMTGGGPGLMEAANRGAAMPSVVDCRDGLGMS
jgi:predicted Rossmann-fold nucleotide-binding protein